MKYIVPIAIGALALFLTALPVHASPAGAVVQLHFQQTPERKVLMAATDAGLVFIGEDFSNFRAFRATALEGREFLWVGDIDILPIDDLISRRKDSGDWGK